MYSTHMKAIVTSQRVPHTGIEPGGHDDELRVVRVRYRQDHLRERRQILRVAHAALETQHNVDKGDNEM